MKCPNCNGPTIPGFLINSFYCKAECDLKKLDTSSNAGEKYYTIGQLNGNKPYLRRWIPAKCYDEIVAYLTKHHTVFGLPALSIFEVNPPGSKNNWTRSWWGSHHWIESWEYDNKNGTVVKEIKYPYEVEEND